MTATAPVPGPDRRPARWRVAGAVSLAMTCCVLTACGGIAPEEPSNGDLGSVSRRVQELEALGFVPAGRTFIGSPLDVGSSVDLLVDRYEVRYGLWTDWMGREHPIPSAFRPLGGRPPVRPQPEAWTEGIPAVGMTLREARDLAAKRSMRLLSFEEWLWCAVGPTCRRVPAGRRQRGFANTLDAALFQTTPVGAFESGQTPEGLYDMLGNVWEWIEPPPERVRTWRVWNDSAWPSGAAVLAPAWVLGGSYLTPEGPLFTRDDRLLALAVTAGHRSNEVGMRCCVDADVYLAALPTGVRLGLSERQRLRAVGIRWGSRAVGLLEEVLQGEPRNEWARLILAGASDGGAR